MHRPGPQLITYADRLAGTIAGVADLLRGPLDGAFDGVHLLPFFHPIDGADAGFDPIDHLTVDARIGDWDDVADLAGDHVVMADVIVNHVSVHSAPVRDWLARGNEADSAEMLLTFDSVFPDGATESELRTIYRPRPGLPFTDLTFADRTHRLAWTTFTADQIDIDVRSEAGWRHLLSILDRLAASGVRMIRLDAVGYAIKKAGTSCFMLPETFEFIADLAAEAHRRDIDVLVEIHSHHQTQIDIAAQVDWVYDFALPPLVLDAFATGDAGPLRAWLRIRPENAITVLDTHDGIGVIDVGASHDRPGLLPPDRIDALVEGIHERSGGTSRLATGAAASNLDLYQVNCTFWDAMGRDAERYVSARLLQLLVPGVPQVYYVGLLAEGNDVDLLERTGVGRDINRHHFTEDEVTQALERPVVRQLLDHLRLRNTHPAFGGTFAVDDTAPDHVLALRWEHDADAVSAVFDLAAGTHQLEAT